VVEKMQHATTNVDNVHRTRPFGAIEIHGKGISTRLKTLETALKSLALIYDLPDDSNVLPFIANAAAIFRKLTYKDPNGKKTPCKFKNVSTINATKLPFPTIRELEQMLEERNDIKLTYRSSNTYDKANTLSIHSFHTKVLNTKTYNALIPFRHLAKNLEDLAALLLTRNGKTYIHAYICMLVTRQMNAPYQKTKKKVQLVGDYGLGVVKILDKICDTIQSEKQLASFIQVFCVPLLSMWFNIRPIMTTMINIISEKDFNQRLNLARKGTDRESLMHGIWFIVMDSGYRVFKIECKTGYTCDLDIQGPELDDYPLLTKYLPLIHRAYETLTNQRVTATSIEKRNYISCYTQKNKRYAFKYHILPTAFPAWETGSSYYIQIDHAFETYAEVEDYTPLKEHYRSGLTRTDLKILKTRSVVVNGSKVRLKPMQSGCHPHASYFVPGTYGKTHPTKDASMKKVNQIYQDYLNGVPAIPPHLQRTKDCELAFSGIGRHFNTEITIDAIDYLKIQTVNRDFLEFLSEKEKSMLKKDAHISKKIVRQHYKVFKDELKDFAGLNRTYDAYITQRLASHPNIPPGEPFNQLVSYNGSTGTLKAKCHDMRNLTILEQQAQSIAIKKFYMCLRLLEEFEATGVLHRGIRCLYDRLKGVLDEAKGIWHTLKNL
jgi:hypothetical protein